MHGDRGVQTLIGGCKSPKKGLSFLSMHDYVVEQLQKMKGQWSLVAEETGI